MTRRCCDVVLAGAALLVLALPLALAAVAVLLFSGRPVLYRQQRIGRGGHPFCLYKLRTMAAGSTGAQVTASDDRRVTPIGRVLRRLKIDELPQLWNVLRGDMTIIGPRPEVDRYVQYYGDCERRILDFTPGLASRAQLVYPQEAELLRASSDPEVFYVRQLMPRKIAVDLAYERDRTFWTDIGVIAEILLLVAGKSFRIDTSVAANARRPCS